MTNNTASTITPTLVLEDFVRQEAKKAHKQNANGMIVKPRAIYFFNDDEIVGKMFYSWNGVKITPNQTYLATQDRTKPWERIDLEKGMRTILGPKRERGNFGIKWEADINQDYLQTSFIVSLIDAYRPLFTPLQRDYQARELGEQRDAEMQQRRVTPRRTNSAGRFHYAA